MKPAPFLLLALALGMAACSSGSGTDGSAAGRGLAGDPALAGGVDRSALGGSFRPGSQEELAATIGDRVLFATDSAQVAPDQRGILERQAAWLNQHRQLQATVEGHADERGTREYNLALGQRRAAAARDILVSNGVAGSRLQTISFGKDRPAQLGSNQEAWAQNRRAVTVVR